MSSAADVSLVYPLFQGTANDDEDSLAAELDSLEPEPPVVTIAQDESDRLKKEFQKYFDLEVPYRDSGQACKDIVEALDRVTSETQWVPRDWIFS